MAVTKVSEPLTQQRDDQSCGRRSTSRLGTGETLISDAQALTECPARAGGGGNVAAGVKEVFEAEGTSGAVRASAFASRRNGRP